MTDDLKERLKVVACCDTDSTMRHFAYAFMEQDPDGDYVTYAAAKAYITDLEARLSAAEAGEDALAEVLRSYRADLCEGFCLEAEWSGEAHNHPEIQRDCGGCLAAAALAAYEARRKG